MTGILCVQVVLLGLFNAQGLGNDHELLLRVTPGNDSDVAVVFRDAIHVFTYRVPSPLHQFL